MASRKDSKQYADRFQQVFGAGPRLHGESEMSQLPATKTTVDGAAGLSARPLPDRAVGGFLLTGEQVVHGLLNLRGIRDSDRWLKRHRAPAALTAGGVKRYLGAEVLRWAAAKFAPSEESKDALLAIAKSLEVDKSV